MIGTRTGAGARSWTARLLEWDVAGPLIVATVGAAVLAFAVREILRGVRDQVLDKFDVARLRPELRRWVDRFGRVGVIARGVVFGVVGAGFIVAALRSRAAETKGVGDALTAIRDWDGGGVVLALVALGLMACTGSSSCSKRVTGASDWPECGRPRPGAGAARRPPTRGGSEVG